MPTLRLASYTLAIHVFGLFALAWLAGVLAEGMRSAGASLEQASHAIADLRDHYAAILFGAQPYLTQLMLYPLASFATSTNTSTSGPPW